MAGKEFHGYWGRNGYTILTEEIYVVFFEKKRMEFGKWWYTGIQFLNNFSFNDCQVLQQWLMVQTTHFCTFMQYELHKMSITWTILGFRFLSWCQVLKTIDQDGTKSVQSGREFSSAHVGILQRQNDKNVVTMGYEHDSVKNKWEGIYKHQDDTIAENRWKHRMKQNLRNGIRGRIVK